MQARDVQYSSRKRGGGGGGRSGKSSVPITAKLFKAASRCFFTGAIRDHVKSGRARRRASASHRKTEMEGKMNLNNIFILALLYT